MAFDFFPAVFLFAACATAFDLRERRIPDPLNLLVFLFSAIASFYAGVLGLFFVFSVLAFVFSSALHKIGAWGGGDAKFFITLSSFMPLFGKSLESAVLLFLVSAFLLGLFLLSGFAIKVLKNERVNYSGGKSVVFAPFLSLAFAIVVLFK